MTMKMKLVAVVTVAVALLWSLPAHASTVSIAFGTPGNVVAGPDASGGTSAFQPFGSFNFNFVGLTGAPPNDPTEVLSSTSQNAGVGTMTVFVTSTGNTPLG